MLALAGIAALFAVLAASAGLPYLEVITQQNDFFGSGGTQDQDAVDAYIASMQSAYAFYELVPWLALAALLAGVAALALAARRAQLAGAASATASRVASSD